MSFNKIDIEGKIMWQDSENRRRKEPDTKPDMYGWKAVDIDGRKMWEHLDKLLKIDLVESN